MRAVAPEAIARFFVRSVFYQKNEHLTKCLQNFNAIFLLFAK